MFTAEIAENAEEKVADLYEAKLSQPASVLSCPRRRASSVSSVSLDSRLRGNDVRIADSLPDPC